MATGRELAGKKLPLIIAFTVLLVAAFGAGCNGFFQDPTLNSVAIQPPNPQVQVGATTTQSLQLWGTYSDHRAQITSGVSWTSSDATVAVFTDNCGSGIPTCAQETSGAATVEGLASGTATITAAAQGLSATATLTAYYGNISNFEVCLGTFVVGQSCNTSTWAPSGSKTGTQDYYVQATYQGSTIDLTTAAVFGAISPTPTGGGSLACDNSSDPAVCTLTPTVSQQTFTFPVTYGTSNSVTVTINVGP